MRELREAWVCQNCFNELKQEFEVRQIGDKALKALIPKLGLCCTRCLRNLATKVVEYEHIIEGE